MTDSNFRLRKAGGAPAISRSPEKKPVEYSPETQRQADEITDKILSRLRDSVRNAALFALKQQKNDSTAKIWMERRVFRPAQEVCERAVQSKKPSLPPPSNPLARADTEATGTWKKAPSSAPKPRTSVPAPSSLKPPSSLKQPSPSKQHESEDDDASAALKRVLAHPDRASVPASRRPTPMPPGSRPKTSPGPAELLETLSLERVSSAPSPEPSVPPSAPPASSVAPPSGLSLPRLGQKLSALAYLDSAGEQATFLLDLIQEIAPAQSILLHTIDARSQEATIVGVHSSHAPALAGMRTMPQDPLLTQVRRLRRPVKILAPGSDERVGKGRWALCPPEKYLVALPVLHGHKLVGLVELADPQNSHRLTQEQLEAIVELTHAWGARLGQPDIRSGV